MIVEFLGIGVFSYLMGSINELVGTESTLEDIIDDRVDDIDLWELNEAFASQCLYSRDRLGIDPDIYNVNGGSIAIGTGDVSFVLGRPLR